MHNIQINPVFLTTTNKNEKKKKYYDYIKKYNKYISQDITYNNNDLSKNVIQEKINRIIQFASLDNFPDSDSKEAGEFMSVNQILIQIKNKINSLKDQIKKDQKYYEGKNGLGWNVYRFTIGWFWNLCYTRWDSTMADHHGNVITSDLMNLIRECNKQINKYKKGYGTLGQTYNEMDTNNIDNIRNIFQANIRVFVMNTSMAEYILKNN